jgi:predicted nucleic acid-binding protein
VIVVDTNTIAYLYLEGERSAQAEAVLAKDPQWIAPVLWRSEFRNVLATYIRQSILSLEDALGIMTEAEYQMVAREFHVTSRQVLNLAATSGCPAYDCEFVVLAEEFGINLVTSDQRILSAFPATAVSLDAFTS